MSLEDTAVHFRNRWFIHPVFTCYQEMLALFLHSGKERVHLQNFCSMIKIASNNKERQTQADVFPASFGVPYGSCP